MSATSDKQKLIDYINQFNIDEIKQLDLNIKRYECRPKRKIKSRNIQYIELHIIFSLTKNELDDGLVYGLTLKE